MQGSGLSRSATVLEIATVGPVLWTDARPQPKVPEMSLHHAEPEQITLRPMIEADLELKVKWANDDVVNAYVGFTERVTLDGTRHWFAAQSTDPTIILLTITLGERPIGYIKLQRSTDENAGYLAGIAIGETDCWGRGYGKAAAQLMLQRAFDGEGWERFWGHFWNPISVKLHEQLGFRKVGETGEKRHHSGNEYAVQILEIRKSDYDRAQPNSATS